MAYRHYLLKRALQGIPVLFGLSIFVFFITRILPGDPVRLALGTMATEEQIQQFRTEMALDEPIYEQYFIWLSGVLEGDWGTSIRTSNDVLADIVSRFPATFELVMLAMVFAIVFAIPLGTIAAMNKDELPDHISRIAAIIGLSMPRFWIAILFQVIFVVALGLFPLTGRLSVEVDAPARITGMFLVDSALTLNSTAFLDALWHIVLPAIALGLSTLAQVMRLLRSDLIEEHKRDYVVAAKAYGLPRNLILLKYMLRNAFTNSLTIIGLAFGFLLGNAFLVEFVFSWPGMAAYGVQSIIFQDFNAIVGVVMVVGFGFVLVNLIVDLLYGYLDPRVRLEHSG
jgi:peptide/nickel transport system permease protein